MAAKVCLTRLMNQIKTILAILYHYTATTIALKAIVTGSLRKTATQTLALSGYSRVQPVGLVVLPEAELCRDVAMSRVVQDLSVVKQYIIYKN